MPSRKDDIDIEMIDMNKYPDVTVTKVEAGPLVIEAKKPAEGVTKASTKFPSSVANFVGIALAKTYQTQLKKTEDVALDFLCNETQHPVVSCFRELTSSDLVALLGQVCNNKMKKKLGTLEQGIVYLALIDYMAVSIDNALYTEQNKPIKNVPAKVQKVMLEFKNIIGSWGLSENSMFKNRYEIVMKYLRELQPNFKTLNFNVKFTEILDSIESEIALNKHKFDMIKSLSAVQSSCDTIESKEEDKIDTLDESDETAVLHKIDLNINLETEENDEEDFPASSAIIWTKLKPPPENKKWSHKSKKNSSQSNGVAKKRSPLGSPGSFRDEERSISQSSVDSVYCSPDSKSTQAQMKDLTKNLPCSSSDPSDRLGHEFNNETMHPNEIKTAMDKNARDSTSSDTTKSGLKKSYSKIVEEDLFLAKKPRLQPQIVITIEDKKENQKTEKSCAIGKPVVNAFAILMNRSKEIAVKNKQKKLSEQKFRI